MGKEVVKKRPGAKIAPVVGFEKTYPGFEYDEDECEYLKAIEQYKRDAKVPFPSFVEVLRIAKKLGWRKDSPAAPVPQAEPPAAVKVRKSPCAHHQKKKR